LKYDSAHGLATSSTLLLLLFMRKLTSFVTADRTLGSGMTTPAIRQTSKKPLQKTFLT